MRIRRYERRGLSNPVLRFAPEGFSSRQPWSIGRMIGWVGRLGLAGGDGFFMVGLAGFEPTTPCPPGKCATRLRYSPFCERARRKAGEMRVGKHGKS